MPDHQERIEPSVPTTCRSWWYSNPPRVWVMTACAPPAKRRSAVKLSVSPAARPPALPSACTDTGSPRLSKYHMTKSKKCTGSSRIQEPTRAAS